MKPRNVSTRAPDRCASERAVAERYGYKYWAGGWSLTGYKDPWAIKILQRGGAVSGYTIFTLTHTPE